MSRPSIGGPNCVMMNVLNGNNDIYNGDKIYVQMDRFFYWMICFDAYFMAATAYYNNLHVCCLHDVEAISTNIICVFFTIVVPTLNVSRSKISACPNSLTISSISHSWLWESKANDVKFIWNNWIYLCAFINGDTAVLHYSIEMIFWDGYNGAI